MQKLSCKQLATDPLPLWKQLVNERITELKSIQKVADEIGYARPSLSLALRDKYIGSTEKLEKKVLQVLGQVNCPFLEKSISPTECRVFETRDAPTQNPSEMRHWRACQGCEVGINKRVKK
ncbi:hypothetical protein F892_03086 [Acinetobacter vivianii]|uniref:Uncharacterized protein n=1 Tax=Acinetobacter vivianii TaxID=1776742 RepID=N9NGR8_9GAMM|nr:hypothetical protein [Acinetobacter vivianii]ENX20163.1 hypothetical protein F892_03086 [Acinetobacter vivianii]GGI59390.1 hypothetical protein GCM10011446_08850 [Acinetobacter vivianii]